MNPTRDIPDPEGIGDPFSAVQRHPWYDPTLSLAANAARCAEWRAREADQGRGEYCDTPNRLGAWVGLP